MYDAEWTMAVPGDKYTELLVVFHNILCYYQDVENSIHYFPMFKFNITIGGKF